MARKRTDPHRKGAIIPAEYEHVLSYNCATTQDGWPIPAFGINCELDGRRWFDADGNVVSQGSKKAVRCENGKHAEDGRCCVVGLLHVAKVAFSDHGGTGKCTACGTSFVYGEVWRHIPTGEHIHIGHICGDNYGLLADRSSFEIEAGRRAAATAAQCSRVRNEEERQEFLDAHPGLQEAFETDHTIVQDIRYRFHRNRQLSDKQIALVFKLAEESKNPKPEETYVKAPTGKQTFRGTVVSVKSHESFYGTTLKMTVKVEIPEGIWLAWGTAPAAILDAHHENRGSTLRGSEVEIKATLEPGRDDHFVFMKRPRGKVTTWAAAA